MDRSPPSTTRDENPSCHARSAYDRQYCIECLVVRNGTTRSRGTSDPRLITRCRRLFSSLAPTALSVRNTYWRARTKPLTAWYVSIHASIPAEALSSVRGGRSSTDITEEPSASARTSGGS